MKLVASTRESFRGIILLVEQEVGLIYWRTEAFFRYFYFFSVD